MMIPNDIAALRVRLLQNTQLALLVNGDGVFWQRAPQDRQPPYVVIHAIEELPESTMSGADDLTHCIYQIDSIGGKGGVGAHNALNMRRFVRQQLHGFAGDVPTDDQPMHFHCVLQRAGRDLPTDPKAGEEEAFIGYAQDFDAWYRFQE